MTLAITRIKKIKEYLIGVLCLFIGIMIAFFRQQRLERLAPLEFNYFNRIPDGEHYFALIAIFILFILYVYIAMILKRENHENAGVCEGICYFLLVALGFVFWPILSHIFTLL